MDKLIAMTALFLLVLPAASARDVPTGTVLRAVDCINHSPALESCQAEIQGIANLVCTEGFGCFVCVQFTAYDDMELVPRASSISVDPLGSKVIAQWFGFFYRGAHDPLWPGEWQLRTSTQNEIWCDGSAGIF